MDLAGTGKGPLRNEGADLSAVFAGLDATLDALFVEERDAGINEGNTVGHGGLQVRIRQQPRQKPENGGQSDRVMRMVFATGCRKHAAPGAVNP